MPAIRCLTRLQVIYCTVYCGKMGRYGIGTELNADYFRDGVGYLKSTDEVTDQLTLFDLMESEESQNAS